MTLTEQHTGAATLDPSPGNCSFTPELSESSLASNGKKKADWMPLTEENISKLYASHCAIVRRAMELAWEQ